MKALKAAAWILLTLAGVAGVVSFAAAQDDGVPVGTIMAWAGEKGSVPADWMICNGKALKIKQYKDLYDAIGWSWGKPAAKRFNLPDLRGRFIRGVDDGAGLDPDADDRDQAAKGGNGKGVGSVQDDALQEHSHYQLEHEHEYSYPNTFSYEQHESGMTTLLKPQYIQRDTNPVAPAISGAIKYKNHASVKLSEETRPKNAGVYFIIKVK